jgi:hypothetical protein
MLRLFLSYARQDVERVRKFSADIRRAGIEPWMDDELKLANRWNDEIDGRIAAADFVLLLLSRATQAGDANRFFRKEWELAYRDQRRIMPVRLEESELPASLPETLASAIRDLQRVDLFPTYEDGLRKILRSLYEAKRTGVFEETFSCLGPDNAGWQLRGWELADADSTGENSRSIHGLAKLSTAQLLPQTSRQVASIDIDLPGGPLMMRYRRRIQLSAPVGGTASFQVVVDGEVVDNASQENAPESEWSTRAVAVPDRGERRARLELTVSASSNMNYFPSAEAWVDDLRIA